MSAAAEVAPAVAPAKAKAPRAPKAPKAPKSPKAPKAAKVAKAPKAAASHPTYADMIKKAIVELKEKTGSSKPAILKFIRATYKVGDNAAQINAHIRLALKRGVTSGALKQTKGTGASGSFKLGETKVAKVAAAKPKVVKKAAPAKPKVAKKAATGEKKPKSPKKKAAAKPKKAATAAKKTAAPKKTITKKAKTASPKKVKAAPKPKAKKAAAPKKA